ncbi:hypothetical protein [Emticicia sp. 17c]|uniref:hypothetical protein n=1 Tax=Emticicia sp. 17c TaxID=3127704 RepID=UPI00301C1E9E
MFLWQPATGLVLFFVGSWLGTAENLFTSDQNHEKSYMHLHAAMLALPRQGYFPDLTIN